MISLFGKPEPTLLERLKQSVSKTRTELAAKVEQIFTGDRPVDPALLAELETALLSADIGVRTTRGVIAALREQVNQHALTGSDTLKRELQNQLLRILRAPMNGSANHAAASTVTQGAGIASVLAAAPPAELASTSSGGTASQPGPRVIFLVGVNGVGKTTTIGKLAHRLRGEHTSVLLCAADTFRAAANEQLEIWAKRTGVEMVKQKPGADPAAVVYDALSSARARNIDVVIVDTAGRLHTKSNLMAELEKMKRTAAKLIPGAPHDVLLVLDATTGQNGLAQAREFLGHAGVTGIVLTKLDGTAKGGIVVAIASELNLPIRFVGTGEQMDDLVPFDPETYVQSLFA
jgi:fused signal recognition particle receptor